MSSSLSYKGYTAELGHIVGFHGETVAEAAFEEAVNDYLDTCNRVGKSDEVTILSIT